jgi:hypothetical protein
MKGSSLRKVQRPASASRVRASGDLQLDDEPKTVSGTMFGTSSTIRVRPQSAKAPSFGGMIAVVGRFFTAQQGCNECGSNDALCIHACFLYHVLHGLLLYPPQSMCECMCTHVFT